MSGFVRTDVILGTCRFPRKSRFLFPLSRLILAALIAVFFFVSGCSRQEPETLTGNPVQQRTEKDELTEQPAQPILTVLCRPEYLPEALLAEYTAQTGVTVFTADPSDQPGLTAADGSFDLALVDSLWLPQLIDEGVLAEINRPGIPNSAAVSRPFSAVPFDPDGIFCVPFLWGTFGIVVNRSVVTDQDIEWEILFDHRFSGKIDMPDDMRLLLEAALRSLGTSLEDADTDTLNRATDLLYEQRKNVRGYFPIPEIIDHLVEGSSYVSCIDNPSADLAVGRSAALEYVVPASGAPLWLLVWVIPATSDSANEARRFIDFFLDPVRIAAVSNANRIANTVGDSKPYLDDILVNTSTIVMSDDASARYRLPEPIDLETENLMMRLRDDFMLK